ncbi:MAG: hypothetical protein GWN86_13670, partial [Desulfobacterales bacterium]|nr:hypothetical protein [Desulfobacterales bacterium]
LVDQEGPQKAYAAVQKVLAQLPSSFELSLRQISVISTEHDLVKLLRAAIHTGPGISGIRFTGNVINGVFIDDAYIYRM